MLSVSKEPDMAKKNRTGCGVDDRPDRRYEMTDAGYERIEDLLPTQRCGAHRAPEKAHAMAGNKGYSCRSVRTWLAECSIKAVPPTRSNQRTLKQDRRLYRGRNVVERCIGWQKECRCVATRYGKLATHLLGMIKLTVIQLRRTKYVELPSGVVVGNWQKCR